MALILKQQANATVTVPPAGSGSVFLNTSDQLTIKDSFGNISIIPTVTSSGNTSVFFNDAGALGQSANLTFVNTTNTLTVSGNVAATGVKTDNLYYANGNPWDLGNPAGSNTQVQFNSNGDFGASSNFTFNNSTSTVQIDGNLVANTMQLGSGIYAWSKTFVHLANSTSNTDQTLYSVSAANISGAEFHIIATDATAGTRQSTKISCVVYDGQIQNNEYAGLYINGGVGQFTVQYVSGAPPILQLRVTPDNNSQTIYKMLVTIFAE